MVYPIEEGAMNTLRRVLLVLVVLALPMATATAAVGKPKPPPPTTPEPTLGGYTCEESGFDQSGINWFWDTDNHPTGFRFTLTLEGRSDGVCIDVPLGDWTGESWGPNVTAGVWTVKVTDYQGKISRLLLVPRDSLGPGDSCGGADLRQPDLAATYELPLPVDPRHEDGIPAATVNACGTQFGEWISGVLVTERTDDPHPLAFFALMEGVKGAQATITVTLP
jgi:hypothetical protein